MKRVMLIFSLLLAFTTVGLAANNAAPPTTPACAPPAATAVRPWLQPPVLGHWQQVGEGGPPPVCGPYCLYCPGGGGSDSPDWPSAKGPAPGLQDGCRITWCCIYPVKPPARL